jgi:hypothetical protein
MARFKQSVVINRPVEQVFAFVSDLENDPPWSGAAEMRRTSPGPVGIGTTFQQRDRFLGRRLELTLRWSATNPRPCCRPPRAPGRWPRPARSRT